MLEVFRCVFSVSDTACKFFLISPTSLWRNQNEFFELIQNFQVVKYFPF